ncbi:MAG TPA: twin-arginine translocation signal domain-containing protein, partial [Polyangiaceae bacterium]|nr:twin-arginine translocation signal domain-containing protein [Polyangiaceae bacterium]
MTRREALALLGALAAAAGCGPRPAVAVPPAPKTPPLLLEPLADLAPAAGLAWLLDLRASELLASPLLAPAIALLLPPSGFDAFAEH